MAEKIDVQETVITVISNNEEDYISMIDMVRDIENGLALIEKWLRNKNTIELLGIWEEIYNPDFNSPEFEGIKHEAGLNRFVLSVNNGSKKQTQKELSLKQVVMAAHTHTRILPLNLHHGFHQSSSSILSKSFND